MDDLPSIKEILKKYELTASKALGQNFLFDINITDKIVNSIPSIDNKNILEIGPGPGLLTRSILKKPIKKLYAIEKDEKCYAALKDYLVPASNNKLELLNADALNVSNYPSVDEKFIVIANLPYNISTELLFRWLDNIDKFEGFLLMFQKEVVDRLMAKPNSKNYGRLAIYTQWLCKIRHVFDVPPSVFYPPPKVTSAICYIKPMEKPLFNADKNKLRTLIKAAFNQRRKTIKNNLSLITTDTDNILAKSGIDPKKRPEDLTIEEFCKLSAFI